MPDQLSKSLRRLLEKYQRAMQATPARMGRADGRLAVPGKTNTIYVTELDGPCVEVLNQRVFPEEFGKLVLIGYDPIHFPLRRQVLSRWDAYPEAGNLGVFPHSDSHGSDGSDPVYISSRQWLHGLVIPVAGSLSVQVYPGTYETSSGWKTHTEISTVSFAASVPATGARAALLVVNSAGSLTLRNGAVVGNYNLVDDTALPATEPGDTVLYAIVCYAGQTEAVETETQQDLIDLRFSNAATRRSLPATTAASDFLIGDGANWLAKTLAETVTILRTALNGIYAALVHTHAATDLTSGTLDGDRLPAMSTTKRGGVPATGTPSGKFLQDNGSWADAGGGTGGGHTIQDGGVDLAQRANLNFTGLGVTATDDEEADATVITIPGGSGLTVYPCRQTVFINEGKVTAGAITLTAPITSTANMPFGFYIATNASGAPADGDELTYYVLLQAGTYRFEIGGLAYTSRAKIDILIDGTVVISGQDWYSAGVAITRFVSTGITIVGSGEHTIKLRVNGRNASATGWLMTLTYFNFSRTDGSGGGSPILNAKFVTAASDDSLTEEIVIPGLAASPDIKGAAGAGTSEEFDSTTDPFTWSAAPSTYNANTTIKSHYYAKMLTGASYIHGTKPYTPEAGVAFDARCKLVVGFSDAGTGTKNVRFGVFSSDYASFQGLLMAQSVTYTPHGNVRLVSVDNGTGIVTIEYRPFCLYLRVTRDTLNFYRYFFSDNGILWTQVGISAAARSFTVAKIGFSMVSNTTAGQYVEMACDWLRTDV